MTGTGLPWTLPLTRAHRRAYNLIPVRQPHTESADLEVVHVAPGALDALVRQATAAGLIDDDVPLLVAGWIDGDLTLQAFKLGVGSQPFPVTIGRPVP